MEQPYETSGDRPRKEKSPSFRCQPITMRVASLSLLAETAEPLGESRGGVIFRPKDVSRRGAK